MYRTRSRDRSTKSKDKLISSELPLGASNSWTEKEERLLYEAIEDPSVDKCWEDIIDKIRKEIQDFNYKPEECMRRYKNFINPSWYNENWPMDQGFFLSVLARAYGYSWTKLAYLLQEKDPSTLKNYFYSYVRKAVRHAGEGYIPWSVLDKVANFFEWMQALEEIKIQCFRSDAMHSNKKIADWVSESQLSSTQLREYKEALIKRFRQIHGEEKLPFTLIIDLERAKIRGVDVETLIEAESIISVITKDLIAIRFFSSDRKKLPVKNEPFKFPMYRSMLPVHLLKRSFPEPIVYQKMPEYLSPVGFPTRPIQSGVIIQSPQEPPFDQHKRKPTNNGDGSNTYRQ
jgi:hypothetical protein